MTKQEEEFIIAAEPMANRQIEPFSLLAPAGVCEEIQARWLIYLGLFSSSFLAPEKGIMIGLGALRAHVNFLTKPKGRRERECIMCSLQRREKRVQFQ